MTDLVTITERQQAAWATGDYGRVGALLQLHNELLVQSLDIHPGERVLDVASGNGGCALAAARRFADVLATDFVPDLLGQAEARAAADGLTLATKVADAQDLPFDDDAFDVVTSTFGAMFAPDQQAVADELVRVCRPGGRIGMVNWVPESLIGDVFKVTGGYVPPPAGLRPASLWGTRERLDELFGDRVASLELIPRELVFCYPSSAFMLDWFRRWYGPTQTAFEALDESARGDFARDLQAVYEKYNQAEDGTLVAPSAYVEVIAVTA